MHCYFFINIQINWPFYKNHLGQNPLILALLFGNCPLIFKHTCSFSNYSVLFSRLIYRCFITLFSTCIFNYNFETFCSCKFIFCALKSEYILLNWTELLNWITFQQNVIATNEKMGCFITHFRFSFLIQARLNSHYEAWSYKKRSPKRLKHTGDLFRKDLQLEGVC